MFPTHPFGVVARIRDATPACEKRLLNSRDLRAKFPERDRTKSSALAQEHRAQSADLGWTIEEIIDRVCALKKEVPYEEYPLSLVRDSHIAIRACSSLASLPRNSSGHARGGQACHSGGG